MEILIVGGIVVLIMVFISTQIKKSAAQAFDREIVETENFTIVKPEGFMNPLRESSEYEFEAYSKEFGEKTERNVWRAQVYLSLSTASDFAAACESAKQKTDEILSEETLEDSAYDEKIYLIESEKFDEEEEIDFYEFRKIVESRRRQKVYELRIAVLKAFRSEFSERINELLNSFHIK
jgi:hypothetical protein